MICSFKWEILQLKSISNIYQSSDVSQIIFKNLKISVDLSLYQSIDTPSDESEPSWLELNNFQLGSAHDLFHSAWKFPY